jgi:hypothetical protein
MQCGGNVCAKQILSARLSVSREGRARTANREEVLAWLLDRRE